MIRRGLASLRTVRPVQQSKSTFSSARKYATQPQASSGGNTGLAVAAVAAAGLGYAGYKYYTNTPIQAKGIPTLSDPNAWVDLKLVAVEPVSHDSKRFRFELPSKDHVIGLHAASALLTKYQNENEKPVIRPYTPVSDETEQGYVDLLVKDYPKGKMSTHIHNLKLGESLSFKGPIEKYAWTPNKHKRIALVAGGTGITPMYQLIRAVFNNPNDKTDVSLIYANKTEGDILLKHEFEELEQKFPNQFRAFYVLETPPNDWPGKGGYITKETIDQLAPKKDESNVKIFVCGPPPLYKAVSGEKVSPKEQGPVDGYLKELGFDETQVFKF